MELGFAGDGVHAAEDLAGPHFVAGLDVDAGKFAVEGEIAAVLHQDALVVAWDDHHVAHRAVEYGFDCAVFAEGYVHAVVERQLNVLVDRMIVLTE